VIESLIPIRFFRLFLETLNAEVGSANLQIVMAKNGLPPDLCSPQAVSRLNSASAAEAYANIQKALRVYYGRGARGVLLRIGRLIWRRLLDGGAIHEKAQMRLIRTMPAVMRRKQTLELLARLLREKPDGNTVHSLDMDLLLVDHASPATLGQKESSAICCVTLGMIQEAFLWATGSEVDVDEIACRAVEGEQCEFKVKTGAK
jgi:predicted hydrocarbon binding protein